jgi:aspartyl-tRNA(Asn)/glutamyl-tRNA(Gln) amidotransferase subunit A
MNANSSPTAWSLAETAQKLAAREISSVELTRAYLAAIERENPKLNAFVTVEPEKALAQAAAADARLAAGERGGVLGAPVALKDNMCAKGSRVTCGSRILENFVAPYDAGVVERLRKAGAVFLGAANMDEFAMGSSTEHSAWGITRNPVDTERIPGGSSGGSAAAVKANLCVAALGSDTGGSIRQPAACCGVVGLKPTYGRVSRYGLVAFASSLDQIGPLTKDVRDSAIMLGAIAGPDHRDSTCVPNEAPDYAGELADEPDLRGMKLALPKEYFAEGGMSPDVEKATLAAIERFKSAGVEFIDVSLPHSKYAVATYYLVATAEASSNLARFDGVHYGRRTKGAKNIVELYAKSRGEGFGEEVKRRIMLGTYALSAGYYDAYYLRALKARTLIKRDFERVFAAGADAVFAPVTPTTAFKLGERLDDPLQMYLSDIYTISTNLAGLPGLAVPCGSDQKGLPIGMQLTGPAFEEGRLFRLARKFEAAGQV